MGRNTEFVRIVILPGQGTLRHYLQEDWLPSITSLARTGKPLAPTTADTYRYEIKRIVEVIGDIRLAKLSVRDLAAR